MDQLLVEELLQVSLDDLLMLRVGRSDERVIRDVQPLPQALKLRRQFIAVRLRINAGFRSSLLHFLSMFIEPGEKEDLPPA